MVYTRPTKRKKKLTYSTGGAVPMPEAVEPPPPPPSDEPDAVQQALQAHLEAERLAREAPPLRNPVDEIIDGLEGLSDHKRNFLRRNPWAMEREMAALMQSVHKAALAAGIQDDTPEMDIELVRGVDRELTARIEKTLRSPTLPEPPMMQPPPAAPAAAPARKHVPVSAPVSRDIPTSSGRPIARPGQITLTAEERAIARNSFGYGNLSDAEKERLYAMNKAKLARMREDGTYTDERSR